MSMGELFLILDDEYRRAFRAQRVFQDRSNPFEIFNDDQLIARYRFPRAKLLEIINLCSDDLRRPTNRSNALPVHCQVLSALRFFAKGSFQVDAGDIEGISQPCVSRSITNVVNILCAHADQFIKFPTTPNELQLVKQGFFNHRKMPNTIGAVDGTLISIKSPSGDQEPLFVSRKGGHGINVQIVCDYNMFITDVVVKWPGSTHDAYIWRNCSLRQQFMENPPSGWLIGDSGYPLEPWLLVPVAATRTPQEERYNVVFKKARAKVENCIGLLKSVFRCLDKSGGALQYKPQKCCKIIVTSVVLHNIRRSLRFKADENFIATVDEEEPSPPINDDAALVARGNEIRNELINGHFI